MTEPSSLRISEPTQVNLIDDFVQNDAQAVELADGRVLFVFSSDVSGPPVIEGPLANINAFGANGGAGSDITARIGTRQPDGSFSFGDELMVNQHTDLNQDAVQVLQLSDGRLVFAFESQVVDGANGLRVRTGTLGPNDTISFGEELPIEEHADKAQKLPQMTELSDGRVLFTFQTSSGVDGDESIASVAARIGTVNPDSTISFGDEFRVNQQTFRGQEEPYVIQLPDGRVLFLYKSGAEAPNGIVEFGFVARIGALADNSTMTFEDEFWVKASGGHSDPQVTQLPDGRVLFTYISDRNEDSGDGPHGVIGRVMTFGPDQPVELGEEFIIDEQILWSARHSDTTVLSDGRILFIFETYRPEANVEGYRDFQYTGGPAGRIGTVLEDGSISLGDVFRIDPYWEGSQSDFEVTALSNGQALLTYSTRAPGAEMPSADVAVRVLDFSGTGTTADDTLVATSTGGLLSGLSGDDTLIGSNGADFFDGGSGSDLIDGNDGHDTVVYQLSRSDVVTDLQDWDPLLLDGRPEPVTVTGPDGSVDTLYDIERIEFRDGDLLFDLESSNLGFTYRIYSAVFGRTPDEAGLRFWTDVMDQIDADASWQDKQLFLARQFLAADEYLDLYGAGSSNEQFVSDLYHNILGRQPDQTGNDFWIGELEAGFSRERVLVSFAESGESQERTAPDLDDGVWVI